MTTKYQKRIIINPKIMTGKPVIKGTRITVELILRLMAQGMKTEEILDNYPHLKQEDIYAALEYGAETIEQEQILPLPYLKQIHQYA